jgi:hypothetical protein
VTKVPQMGKKEEDMDTEEEFLSFKEKDVQRNFYKRKADKEKGVGEYLGQRRVEEEGKVEAAA